jgi:hypothetical protein
MDVEHLMIKLIRSAVLSVFLVPTMAGAQDFDKGLAAYEAGDFVRALSELTPLAEQGNADAQYKLGLMYRNGRGVLQDGAKAVRWYRLWASYGVDDDLATQEQALAEHFGPIEWAHVQGRPVPALLRLKLIFK